MKGTTIIMKNFAYWLLFLTFWVTVIAFVENF